MMLNTPLKRNIFMNTNNKGPCILRGTYLMLEVPWGSNYTMIPTWGPKTIVPTWSLRVRGAFSICMT